jgi:hypothetical protein
MPAEDPTPKSVSTKIYDALRKEPIPFTSMPPSTDVLLAHPADRANDDGGTDKPGEMERMFDQYFSFKQPVSIEPGAAPAAVGLPAPDISPDLLACLRTHKETFPPSWSFPHACANLGGSRGVPTGPLKRLFFGDLVWLFYMERMGVFQMLGAVLDDFARKGKYPLPYSNVRGVTLETMVRETKVGLSSTLRDRDSSYRRCLGWTIESARSLGSESMVNSGFSDGFHRLIILARKLNRDKRLASLFPAAGGATPRPLSTSTLKAIRETIEPLQIAMKQFEYGRNYTHTLTGIVWAVASLLLIRDVRTTLGIPSEHNSAATYIPTAYKLLVGGAELPRQGNRFLLHRECAELGRDILLDLQVLTAHQFTTPEIGIWLDLVEDRVEGYATAYEALTGIDLGGEKVTTESIRVEQQV